MSRLAFITCFLAFSFSQLTVSARTFDDFLAELKHGQESLEHCYGGVFRSCAEEPTKLSGPYKLQPFLDEPAFEGYCEQQSNGGGWLVIQHRSDGSEKFYRGFSDYRKGFGALSGEFWIGLEMLHRLTANRNTQLLIELEDFNDIRKHAKYDGFEIGSEHEGYALKKLGPYCGTAGDGLRYNEGAPFSTFDSDRDQSEASCAVDRKGAWWYRDCTFSNLNGVYEDKNEQKAMNWFPFKESDAGLSYSKMMIRGF